MVAAHRPRACTPGRIRRRCNARSSRAARSPWSRARSHRSWSRTTGSSGVALDDGHVVPADAVVVGPRMIARSGVLAALGLARRGAPDGIRARRSRARQMGATEIPGVWVAGNVAEIDARSCTPPERERLPARRSTPISSPRTRARRCDVMHAAMHTATPAGVRQEVLGRAVRIGVGDLERQPEPQLVTEVADLRARHPRWTSVPAKVPMPCGWLSTDGGSRRSTSRRSRWSGRSTLTAAEDARPRRAITWQQADVTEWDRRPDRSISCRRSSCTSRRFSGAPYIHHCAAAVRPGGVLLVVGPPHP